MSVIVMEESDLTICFDDEGNVLDLKKEKTGKRLFFPSKEAAMEFVESKKKEEPYYPEHGKLKTKSYDIVCEE